MRRYPKALRDTTKEEGKSIDRINGLDLRTRGRFRSFRTDPLYVDEEPANYALKQDVDALVRFTKEAYPAFALPQCDFAPGAVMFKGRPLVPVETEAQIPCLRGTP